MRVCLLGILAACGPSAPERSPVTPIGSAQETHGPALGARGGGTRRCYPSFDNQMNNVAVPEGTKVSAQAVMFDRDCKAFEEAGYGRDDEERGRTMPTGFDVVSSKDEYKSKFKCTPPKDLDLANKRFAALRFNHQTPDSAQLESVLDDGQGHLTAVFVTDHAQQGIAPTTEHSVLAFVLPKSDATVSAVFCDPPVVPGQGNTSGRPEEIP